MTEDLLVEAGVGRVGAEGFMDGETAGEGVLGQVGVGENAGEGGAVGVAHGGGLRRGMVMVVMVLFWGAEGLGWRLEGLIIRYARTGLRLFLGLLPGS